jgi:formiminotetrahydrofolate cyclodeaminase
VSGTSTEVSVAGLPVSELQDVLAKAGPGPAGGSAAAVAATMAAGLVRLVARVSNDWPDAPGVAAQASALGDRALALADDDHRVYARAMAELASPGRDATLGAALRRAAEVPLQIAEAAADVALLASLAAQEGSETVRGDAWAAAALAEAATVCAAQLVHVNLATKPDDELSLRADDASRAAASAREVALSTS